MSQGMQGAPRVHPARLGELRRGSDVLALLEAISRHEDAGKSAVYARAQEVYQGVKRSSKLPHVFRGVDKELAARRQRKLWLTIGLAMEQVGTAVGAAERGWCEAFGDPRRRRRSTSRRGIDATK